MEKQELKQKGFGENAIKLIGSEVDYVGKTGENIRGVIKKVRFADCVIVDVETKERSAAIQFLIKPSNGARARWTTPFKNA